LHNVVRMEISRSGVILVVLALGVGMTGRASAADPGGDERAGESIAVTGGMVALTLAADVELQSRWGPALAAGVGERGGPAFNVYLGESIRLGTHWSLRPGVRFERAWQTVQGCPTGCTFDLFLVEAAVRYQASSGFLVQFGLPIVGWVPVGPDAGEAAPHLQFYTLATGDLAMLATLFVGYAFDL
jgi:hypothetical protein